LASGGANIAAGGRLWVNGDRSTMMLFFRQNQQWRNSRPLLVFRLKIIMLRFDSGSKPLFSCSLDSLRR
jgi:hypothetical protein